MRQYEIWWATLPPPIGQRPVLLLTRNAAYRYLNRITVVEITSKPRGIRQEVWLDRREGVSRPCVARFDNLASIPKESLRRRLGQLAPARVSEIKRAVGHTFAWQELLDD